ncbi:HAD-IA family hydrolase [Chloroflexota bacterium]
MSLVLLIDLDDTLLGNEFDDFLPHYLESFSKTVEHIVEPEKFVRALLSSTQDMFDNRQPDRTLREAFEASFYPALNLDEDKFQAAAEKFYAEVFPTLRELTYQKPAAIRLIEYAQKRGYTIAIATNPLFPMTAISQRLSWGNLSSDKFNFQLISSYETFHFAKPDLGYYAEVMARLGWPEDSVIMIGDDLEKDILPALRLGLPAFWVNIEGNDLPNGFDIPDASGDLGDVIPWLQEIPHQDLLPDYSSPAAMLAILRATPAVLDTFCRHLPLELWKKRPLPGEWGLLEIICHLRDVDNEVNTPRLHRVLKEIDPFIPGEDTDPWAQERGYVDQNGLEALQQFITARLELLDMLEAVKTDEWRRPARHVFFGRTALAELVNIIAQHDRLHIRQIHQNLEVVAL